MQMQEVGRADLGQVGRLLLHTTTHDLSPGEVVQGILELSLTQAPLLVRGVWLKFSGKNTLRRPEEDGGDYSVDLLLDDPDYHNGGVQEVFVGFGEATSADEADIVELNSLQHSWNFAFRVPAAAAFSFCDERADVQYSLTAVLDTPAVPLSVSTLTHTLVVGCLQHEELQSIDTPPSVLGYVPPAGSAAPAVNTQALALASRRARMGRLSRALLGLRSAVLGPRPVPEASLKMLQPAVFSFDDSRCTLPVKVVLKHCDVRRRCLSLTIRLVATVLTRPDEFTPYAAGAQLQSAFLNDTAAMQELQQRRYNGEGGSSRSRGKKKNAKGGGGCKQYVTVLWKAEKRMRLAADDAAVLGGSGSLEVPVQVPVLIDSKERQRCLRDWPAPSPLVHRYDENAARLITFTSNSPLQRTSYSLHVVVTAAQAKGEPGKVSCEASGDILVLPPNAEEEETSDPYVSINVNAAGPQPVVASPRATTGAGAGGTPQKTPRARLAPVRVVGELISRGPAAVLVDRGARRNRQADANGGFAVLHPISVSAATCVAGTPVFSPALAHVCNTIDRARFPRTTGRNGTAAEDDEDEDAFPHFTLGTAVPDTPLVVGAQTLTRTMSRINESTESADGTPATDASRSPAAALPFVSPLVGASARAGSSEESKYDDESDYPQPAFASAGSTRSRSSTGSAEGTRSVSPVGGDLQLGATQGFVSTLGALFQSPREGEEDEQEQEQTLRVVNGFADLLSNVTTVEASGSGGVVALLQDCVLNRVSVGALEVQQLQQLLQAMASTADREAVLLLLLREQWVSGACIDDLFQPGSCVDACFALSVQRDRVKSHIRHESLSHGQRQVV